MSQECSHKQESALKRQLKSSLGITISSTEERRGHFTQMPLGEEVKNNGEEIWETGRLIWLKYIAAIKCVVLCKMCKSLTLNSIFCHTEKSPHICLCVCVAMSLRV